MKYSIAAAVSGLVFACAAAHADPINMIGNGSFENGFSGYTVAGSGTTPGTGPQIITYGSNATGYGDNVTADPFHYSPDAAGSHAAFFVDDNAHETVTTTTASLTAGTTYEVGFDFFETLSGARNPNGFSLATAVGGVSLATLTQTSVGYTAGIWYHIFDTFTAATSGPESFVFTYNSGAYAAKDVIVDDLYLMANGTSPGAPNTPVAVPEPATYAIFSVALLGLALVRRKLVG